MKSLRVLSSCWRLRSLYNSATGTISSNLRLRWEYTQGSELFVVYMEAQDTDPLRPDRFVELKNRGFIVKVNRFFRF